MSLGERRIRIRASCQQGVLDGSLGQRGLARGLEGNWGVPGGAARAVVLLIPSIGGPEGPRTNQGLRSRALVCKLAAAAEDVVGSRS